jgi:hypothetical protein
MLKIEKVTETIYNNHPMFEEGIQLVDMVYLKKNLLE